MIFSSNTNKHLENVAIVGAGGRCGRSIVKALVEGGKHRVTALMRPDSTSNVPSGVHHIEKADYNDHTALVAALNQQDVLVITMAVTAPKDSQTRLIDAAVEAGVKYIIPNEWGVDLSKEGMSKDVMLGDRILPIRAYIERTGAGKTKWIGVCCGFWYEFSLAGTEVRYGFDFDNKRLTLFDDGETKINTSTWPQVGRAVAHLLSLKVTPDSETDTEPCLSNYDNKSIHVKSFFISQRDMFASVLRVTGDREEDWTVTHEDYIARFSRGQQLMKHGNMSGWGIVLYTRCFYKDGAGDYNDKLDNDALGLPQEDFDQATRIAVKMALAGETNVIH